MEVHIPFLKGLHEETEKRLLPQGYLTRAENVRFEKEGRVVSRNGYAFIDGASEVADVAAASYQRDRTLHFSRRTSTPGQWWQRKPDGTFTDPAYASCLSPIETVKRTVATPTIRFSALASDIAHVDGYVFVVYNDSDTPDHQSGGLFFSVYERQTMQLVTSGVIVDYGSAASTYFNPKCIVVGTDVIVFYVLDDELLMWSFDSTALTGAAVTLSPTLSWAAPVAGHHTSFDLCLYDADEVAVCTEFIVAGVSTGIAVYRVTTAGALSIAFTNSDYGSEPKQVGITPDTGGFGIGVVTDGMFKWGLFTSAGVVLTAVDDIDDSGDVVGSPLLTGAMTTWAVEGSPAGKMGTWQAGTIAAPRYIQALWPVCKPFTSGDGAIYCWTADLTHPSADDPDGEAGGFGTYRLVDIFSLSTVGDQDAGETVSDAVCAQEQALAANFYFGEHYDQRRNSVLISETDENGQTVSTCITALPTLVGLSRTSGRIDFCEFRSGTYADKLFSAKLNGQLFLSGSRLREFDGSQLYESGLFQGPNEFALAESGEGADLQGTFQYVLVWKWIDAGGRIHRSQPSSPKAIDLASESTGVAITVAPPPFSDRKANGTTTIYVEVYRTLADESIFHLLNPEQRYVYSPDLATPLVIDDENEDADIESNEVVYTQVGSTLANREPPPCKYLWAGEDRLLVGGLEDRSMYQFSKKSRPGLAVSWSSAEVFRGTIEGEVTGVAQLDGTWFIGSRESIWAIVGSGPDDGGAGEFSPPRKLPSDTGFQSFRSILEVPQGLLFQGKGNRMFLLPRGGAAPSWIGRMVQDTLDAYPFITCATYLPEENIAVFACRSFADGDDIEDDGRLLIFDTDTGEWVTDNPFFLEEGDARVFTSLTTWGSKLLLNGNIEETGAWTDDIDGASPIQITGHVITGDVRFFGANGYGRCRNVMLLGEAVSDFVNLTIQVSRDSGATWDTPAPAFSPAAWTEPLEYRLPYVRGDAFRFWITVTPCDSEGVPTPDEGAALNALSCEVFQSGGLNKVAQESRA